MAKSKKGTPQVNASSMADIAFLLLIFFLVTTTIASDKGIAVLLPPKIDQQDVKINERNIFNILINSKDMLLAEDEPCELEDLKAKVKAFVTNNDVDPKLSESPDKAVVSLKTDRGTSYERYIMVYDELKKAYHELRAEYLGITLEQFNALDMKNPEHVDMYNRAKDMYKIQISDADPTDINALLGS